MADDPEFVKQLTRIECKLDSALEDTARLCDVIYGDTGANGLSGRLTLLEEKEARRGKHIWLLTTAAVAAIGGMITRWFSSR